MSIELSNPISSRNNQTKSNTYVQKLNRRRHLSTISFNLSQNENLISYYEKTLNQINDPNFNIFSFQKSLNLTNSNLMYTISNFIFEKLGFYKENIISKKKLKSFTNKVVSLYKSNPYHNSIQACDIIQTCHIILLKGNFK